MEAAISQYAVISDAPTGPTQATADSPAAATAISSAVSIAPETTISTPAETTSQTAAAMQPATSLDTSQTTVTSAQTQTNALSPAQTSAATAEDKVPIMAVGSGADPVEYAAPSGDVDVRFATSATPGSNLVDVSNGDKGFSIRFEPSSGDSVPTPATVSGNGEGYVDSSGAHLLLVPASNRLSGEVTFAPGSPNTLSLDLPLYGLFGEPTSDGDIALLDLDTGKQVFTISGGQVSVGGSDAGQVTLSLIDSANEFLRLLITSPTSGQTLVYRPRVCYRSLCACDCQVRH